MATIQENALPSKSSIVAADKLRAIGSDSKSYQALVSDVAKYIVENYNGSTLAGSAQSVQSALSELNSKTVQRNIAATEDLNGIINTGNYSVGNSSTANWPLTGYGVLFVRNCLAYIEQYAVAAISQETMARISLDGGTSWRSWKTIASPS